MKSERFGRPVSASWSASCASFSSENLRSVMSVCEPAMRVARPLAGKPDAGNLAEKAYLQALSAAAAQSLNEAHEGPEPDSEFLTVRQ